MKEKLIGAMIYPAMVLAVALAGIIIISRYVLPRVSEIFAQLDTVLPVRIQSIVHSGNILLVLVLCSVVLSAGFVVLYLIAHRRGWKSAVIFDKVILTIPFIGTLKNLGTTSKVATHTADSFNYYGIILLE